MKGCAAANGLLLSEQRPLLGASAEGTEPQVVAALGAGFRVGSLLDAPPPLIPLTGNAADYTIVRVETLLGRTSMAFGDDEHDVADLVLVGLLTCEWQALEANVERGLMLEAGAAPGDAADVEDALRAFRHDQRLIAASELRTWLSNRSLVLADLVGVLRRQSLRGAHQAVAVPECHDDRALKVMRAEAICTGALMRCAAQLRTWHAGCLAGEGLNIVLPPIWPPVPDPARVENIVTLALADVASGLPTMSPQELRRRAIRLASLEAGYSWFRSAGVSEAAVDARVAERRLDWTVVQGNELSFDSEGPALETRLRVVHDGEALAMVAAGIHRATAPREMELGDVPPALAAELLAARPGELVGPWRDADGWRVFERADRVVHGSDANKDVRTRARDELLGELVERFAAGRAVFLAAL